eukprot:357281-Chlamydomonas_euryale.AAC.14
MRRGTHCGHMYKAHVLDTWRGSVMGLWLSSCCLLKGWWERVEWSAGRAPHGGIAPSPLLIPSCLAMLNTSAPLVGRPVTLTLTYFRLAPKQATEVGTFVEQSLGLAEGWLLPTFGRSSPSQEVVFMYISPQHRVIGMLVLEYIARSSTLATIEPNYTSQAILPAESDVGRNPPSTCLRGSGVLEPCGQPSWFGCSDIVSICQADMETGCMKALQADAQKTHHSSSASLSDTKDSASASPICGVRAMWVSMESRRTKLASRMLTIARQHMIHGYTVPRQRLAFAQVNDAGRAFAEAYMAGILSLHFYQ